MALIVKTVDGVPIAVLRDILQ